jgi:hypothetical protein
MKPTLHISLISHPVLLLPIVTKHSAALGILIYCIVMDVVNVSDVMIFFCFWIFFSMINVIIVIVDDSVLPVDYLTVVMNVYLECILFDVILLIYVSMYYLLLCCYLLSNMPVYCIMFFIYCNVIVYLDIVGTCNDCVKLSALIS